jgi:uncharacterized membrane protein (GlpM family)
MPPELAFVLLLGMRMVVAAAFVIAASIITERSGPVIGALVASLPVSAGPAYVFLAADHDAGFIADAALASLPLNATAIFMGLAYVVLAQRFNVVISFAAAITVWLAAAVLVRSTAWSLASGIFVNLVAFAVCLPLVQRFRTAKMPLIVRRWYDIPLRATLVATLVATVVTLSNTVGPKVSGIIALFPVVFSSLMLILHPRIGGPATAAVIANGLWGLIGFGIAIVVLHLATARLGAVAGLSLALATCVAWNLGLWLYGRRKLRVRSVSRP